MSSESAATADLRAGPREWLGLAVLALPLLVLALNISVLFLAAPQLGADLRPSSTGLLWIMDIYGFMIAGFLVCMGTLGDRVGRRRLLVIGAVAFALASLLVAYSVSAPMLIVARALLGIAGATLMPSTLALLSTMFRDPQQRGVAIAVWMTAFSVGMAAGPVIGGVMLEHFWWGSVFLLGVPVMGVLVVLAPVLLPEYRDAQAGKLDVFSVALSLVTIVPIIYGIKESATGHASWPAYVAIAVGLFAGVLFVRRQRRITDPMIDVRLFGNRAFTAALALLVLGIMAINGMSYLYPQFLQSVRALSPMATGLWMIVIAVAAVLGSMVAPLVARRVRPAYVIAGGALISVAGFLLMTQIQAATGMTLVMAAGAAAVVGLSPIGVMSTDMVLTCAQPEKAGSAAALSETSAELGAGLGVAVLGTLGAAVYRNQITESVPDGLPIDVADSARNSFNDALAEVGQVPPELGDRLLKSAREAFTGGLNVVGAASAAILAVLAVVTVALLRHLPPTGRDEQEGPPGIGTGEQVETTYRAET
nr:MFS transporter [Kibdelosporangium sp. MJ126-NF4]CEL13069.1 major facilitator superfamily MFS_1 [Kibdelosporangium sp. MJ126-NF4]CTQ98756.1 major facilitator superfamily MFS_1 [Kibdelosporangium sp. MJ126-NF4]